MADRFKFAEVRQEIIEMLKVDLLGPSSENEILNQNPRFEYIVGMLAPQTSENDSNEQEIGGDASFDGDADYTVGEDDDNEPVSTNRFKTPSSIGISFYLESQHSFNIQILTRCERNSHRRRFFILYPAASQRIHSGCLPGHSAQYLIPGVSDLPVKTARVR